MSTESAKSELCRYDTSEIKKPKAGSVDMTLRKSKIENRKSEIILKNLKISKNQKKNPLQLSLKGTFISIFHPRLLSRYTHLMFIYEFPQVNQRITHSPQCGVNTNVFLLCNVFKAHAFKQSVY